jgi:hypothetical protein
MSNATEIDPAAPPAGPIDHEKTAQALRDAGLSGADLEVITAAVKRSELPPMPDPGYSRVGSGPRGYAEAFEARRIENSIPVVLHQLAIIEKSLTGKPMAHTGRALAMSAIADFVKRLQPVVHECDGSQPVELTLADCMRIASAARAAAPPATKKR